MDDPADSVAGLLRDANAILEHLRLDQRYATLVESMKLARDECSTKALKLQGVAKAEHSVRAELADAVSRLRSEIQRHRRSLDCPRGSATQ